MYRLRRVWVRFPLLLSVVIVSIAGGLWTASRISRGSMLQGEATIFPPTHVGGASDAGDERDADVYPAVAYDPSTGRYLVVWLSLRNADSSRDGFDVYGAFLDQDGRPIGSEFRISDSNDVARNNQPTVIAGHGEFVVAWAEEEGWCRVYAQRVTDSSDRPDRLVVSADEHRHSPNLAYNSERDRYAVAYVAGDDYLPPTFFSADTADCGDNAASLSGIEATEFYFSGDELIAGSLVQISDANGGAFRPRIGYSSELGRYMVAWEDRRNDGGEAYRFDVYGQRLGGDLSLQGSDLALATGGEYANYDTSATWTPRPAVAAGDDQFLVTWFRKEVDRGATIWWVEGRLLPGSGAPDYAFAMAQMEFAQPHPGEAPTGYLSGAFLGDEYLVGLTSQLESVFGYLSLARLQRVHSSGQLLAMDGTAQDELGVGQSIDYENDDQVAVGLAVNPVSGLRVADYLAVYSKHHTDQTAQDFDIYSVRLEIPAPYLKGVYLPIVSSSR